MGEELTGGRVGKIHRVNETVLRPCNRWTKDVHRFLDFLQGLDADFVPKPLGVTAHNEEILSFMPGEVFNYPLPENLLTNSMVVSAAELLLKFHSYSEKYISRSIHEEQWMLPITLPIEVMCHGDFAPYNVTVIDNKATGIIDFDTLHPGPSMWDIAYAIYRWVPFGNPASPDSHGTLQEQIRKIKLFLDTYGVEAEVRRSFVPVLIRRLTSLINYMRGEEINGNEDVQLNIEEGHLQLYLDDIEYIRSNEVEITNGI